MTAYAQLPKTHPLTRAVPIGGPRGLDPGIGAWVNILRSHGVETYESCEGGEGHSYAEPTIAFGSPGDLTEGFHAFAVARTYGMPVKAIRRVWTAHEGELLGPCWHIVFWRKVGEPRPFRPTLGEA